MIKVQHRKIYATYYEDMSLGIGMELKKCNFITIKMNAWVYL
jgi:hypothetical protein